MTFSSQHGLDTAVSTVPLLRDVSTHDVLVGYHIAALTADVGLFEGIPH